MVFFRIVRKGFVGYRQSQWTKQYTRLTPGLIWSLPFLHTVTMVDADYDAAKLALAVEKLRAEADAERETAKTEAVAAECARITMLSAALGSPVSAGTYLLERERLGHISRAASSAAKTTFVFGRESK